MEFVKVLNEELPAIYEGMRQNFIRDEIRQYADLLLVSKDERYGIYHIVEEGTRVGFTGIWDLNDAAFVEHIAIYEPFRDRGYGTAAIELIKKTYGKVLLEMEAPQDEEQIRRYNFYSRLGFHMNAEEYYQPSYHSDSRPYPLKLMSYPEKLDAREFAGARAKIYAAVYKQDIARVKASVNVRKMDASDDKRQVAKLIYGTDDYVFPYMFDDKPSAAEDVFAQMIERDTIYSRENIYVADIDGFVAAIAVMKRAPIRVNAEEMLNSFVEANHIIDEHFAKVYNEYYKLLEEEPSGIYIANVCVDESYRGYGLAYELLEKLLRDDEEYNLETVKRNAPALRTYLKAGFEIVCEYPGFTGVPCYKMHRAKRG